jgi:hypothetical protein
MGTVSVDVQAAANMKIPTKTVTKAMGEAAVFLEGAVIGALRVP